jgi:hypothetical protein
LVVYKVYTDDDGNEIKRTKLHPRDTFDSILPIEERTSKNIYFAGSLLVTTRPALRNSSDSLGRLDIAVGTVVEVASQSQQGAKPVYGIIDFYLDSATANVVTVLDGLEESGPVPVSSITAIQEKPSDDGTILFCFILLFIYFAFFFSVSFPI